MTRGSYGPTSSSYALAVRIRRGGQVRTREAFEAADGGREARQAEDGGRWAADTLTEVLRNLHSALVLVELSLLPEIFDVLGDGLGR